MGLSEVIHFEHIYLVIFLGIHGNLWWFNGIEWDLIGFTPLVKVYITMENHHAINV